MSAQVMFLGGGAEEELFAHFRGLPKSSPLRRWLAAPDVTWRGDGGDRVAYALPEHDLSDGCRAYAELSKSERARFRELIQSCAEGSNRSESILARHFLSRVEEEDGALLGWFRRGGDGRLLLVGWGGRTGVTAGRATLGPADDDAGSEAHSRSAAGASAMWFWALAAALLLGLLLTLLLLTARGCAQPPGPDDGSDASLAQAEAGGAGPDDRHGDPRQPEADVPSEDAPQGPSDWSEEGWRGGDQPDIPTPEVVEPGGATPGTPPGNTGPVPEGVAPGGRIQPPVPGSGEGEHGSAPLPGTPRRDRAPARPQPQHRAFEPRQGDPVPPAGGQGFGGGEDAPGPRSQPPAAGPGRAETAPRPRADERGESSGSRLPAGEAGSNQGDPGSPPHSASEGRYESAPAPRLHRPPGTPGPHEGAAQSRSPEEGRERGDAGGDAAGGLQTGAWSAHPPEHVIEAWGLAPPLERVWVVLRAPEGAVVSCAASTEARMATLCTGDQPPQCTRCGPPDTFSVLYRTYWVGRNNLPSPHQEVSILYESIPCGERAASGSGGE